MPDAADKLDAKLDAFERDTGIWPPGRDMPAAMCGGENQESIRWSAWEYWLKATAELARLQTVADRLESLLDTARNLDPVLIDGIEAAETGPDDE